MKNPDNDLALLVPPEPILLIQLRYILGRDPLPEEIAGHTLNGAYEAKKREKGTP